MPQTDYPLVHKPFLGIMIFLAMLLISVGVVVQYFSRPTDLQSHASAAPMSTPLYGVTSPFNHQIPATAIYTLDTSFGSFRQVYSDYSVPIYRLTQPLPSLVTITNNYSGRIVNWPIPTTAVPATGSDHHLAVVDPTLNVIDEMWDASWSGTANMTAGGMQHFALNGNGISNPINQTVTASGFAVSGGMVVKEDFTNPLTGQLDPTLSINHALSAALPNKIISNGGFVAPAVAGEVSSGGKVNAGVIPLGALYAIPKSVNVDALNVNPLSKALLRAARDYGIYINDTNAAADYNSKPVGTIRIEPGLTDQVFGQNSDNLISTVQADVYSVIAQYGIDRVTGVDFSYVNNTPQVLPSPSPVPSPTPLSSTVPVSSPVPLSSPTSQQQIVSLLPSQAATVRMTSPKTAYPTSSLLKIGGGSGDLTYLVFPLQNVPKATLASATLQFTVNNPSTLVQTIKSVVTTWSNPLTYNSRPQFGAVLQTFSGASKTGVFSVDVTKVVQAALGQPWSIGFDGSTGDALWFNSTTTTTPPRLILKY